MDVLDTLGREASKLNPALVILLVSWFIGLRLTVSWNLKQKKRELDLATAHEFQALYGEFFAIWKLWRHTYRDHGGARPSQDPTSKPLLQRACDVEGRLESTLVRLACERTLEPADIETLGRFRQLYQQLRESIAADQPIRWTSSEHPDYVAFKTLATRIASIIVDDTRRPTGADAANALLEITSNKWEQLRSDDYRFP